MAKEKSKGAFLILWLIIIIAISIASLFRDFLSLTYLFVGGRTTFYMTDTIRLLGFVNIIFTAFLFKLKKWSFFAVSGILGIMLLLSIFSGRPHLIAIYLISLGVLILLIKKKWGQLD
ncbi:MAG: hypothetical protein U9O94_11510 [Nanoarchaeota archaeon]|nr:hypothetical protein [Nanoarchaeota archaeon]